MSELNQRGAVVRAAPALRRASRTDPVAFLHEFLRHPQQIGSVVPSSAFLERRLVRAGVIARARTVVELGPGTGGTTRALLRAMAPDARLLAIELSPVFSARLAASIRDPRFALAHGSAEDISTLLATHRMPRADAIVSGIPFSTMRAAVAARIAAELIRSLAPGARFVAYQLRAHVADFVSPYLGAPQREWALLNIPPLRVFTWTNSA
jgi:phospholipid N-methyltransferase